MTEVFDFFQFPFLTQAWIASLLSSLVCGIIGSFVVVRRIGHIAGGISHTILGGMGAAVFGFQPTLGAFISGVFSALLIGFVSLRSQEQENTFINALWAIGMAIGIIFIHLTPGYNSHLIHFLFGNILMTTDQELMLLAALNTFVVVSVLLFFKQLQAICFDSEYASLRGVPAHLFYLFLLVLISVTIVSLVQMVGVILVIALLSLPAAISLYYFHTLKKIIFSSIFIGAITSTFGLFISFQMDTPSGATIILLLGLLYIFSFLIQFIYKKN